MTNGLHPDDLASVRQLASRDPTYASDIDGIVDGGANLASRSEMLGHVTVSACVINNRSEGDLILTISSTKFSRLLLPGGHVDAGERLFEAAQRELLEECGLGSNDAEMVNRKPVSINAHWISAAPDKREGRHRHFDVHFLFKLINRNAVVFVDKREASSFMWVRPETLMPDYPELITFLSEG